MYNFLRGSRHHPGNGARGATSFQASCDPVETADGFSCLLSRGRAKFQRLETSEDMAESNDDADPAEQRRHVHQEKSDALDRKQICQRLVKLNDERLQVLGHLFRYLFLLKGKSVICSSTALVVVIKIFT